MNSPLLTLSSHFKFNISTPMLDIITLCSNIFHALIFIGSVNAISCDL